MSLDRSSLAPSSWTIFSVLIGEPSRCAPRCEFASEVLIAGSGDRRALVEARVAPFAALEHVAQNLDSVVNIHMARVQRREAEAQDVGRAKVADHAARDQRLHDRV